MWVANDRGASSALAVAPAEQVGSANPRRPGVAGADEVVEPGVEAVHAEHVARHAVAGLEARTAGDAEEMSVDWVFGYVDLLEVAQLGAGDQLPHVVLRSMDGSIG
jgi:hypothetical protein